MINQCGTHLPSKRHSWVVVEQVKGITGGGSQQDGRDVIIQGLPGSHSTFNFGAEGNMELVGDCQQSRIITLCLLEGGSGR